MHLDNLLSGRRERRLPIMVVVQLRPSERVPAEEHERTYTDNVSGHGVRVLSTHPWHPGEQAEITPVSETSLVCGEVVYCQKLADARFFVGLKFPHSRPSWAVLQRFNGI